MQRFLQIRSLHAAASVIGIIHDHKSFPEFLVPSYVKAEIAVHWNPPYDRKQGCHPCLHLLIKYSTNSKKEISTCVAGIIVAVVETMEVAAMAAVAMAVDAEVTAGADAVIIAEAGVGITGAVAALADGTGIQEKHSEMVSVMVMMPVSVMDSGKDGTMTAGQADLVVLDGRMKAVDAAEFNIGGFMPPIILPSII